MPLLLLVASGVSGGDPWQGVTSQLGHCPHTPQTLDTDLSASANFPLLGVQFPHNKAHPFTVSFISLGKGMQPCDHCHN